MAEGEQQKWSMDHVLSWKSLGVQSIQLIKEILFGTASNNEVSAEKDFKQDSVSSETKLELYIPKLKTEIINHSFKAIRVIKHCNSLQRRQWGQRG